MTTGPSFWETLLGHTGLESRLVYKHCTSMEPLRYKPRLWGL